MKQKLLKSQKEEIIKTIHDLYLLNEGNQTFLNAWFIGNKKNNLKIFKEQICDYLFPEIYNVEDFSISNAKKAISIY
ncbi:MAG: hypothetical protein GY817_08940 [bacterium]|nr:hypothetical protein [bacterium]